MTPKLSLDGFTISTLKLSQNASGVGTDMRRKMRKPSQQD